MYPLEEAAMGSPAEKPARSPMKSLEGPQQNYPSPKTREEAGQLAIRRTPRRA